MQKSYLFANWASLILIVLLVLFSIYGAFLGSADAREFFNSRLIAVYWFALLFALLTGLVNVRKMVNIPGLLLIHLGCTLVLVGAIYGSEVGHQIQRKFFGIDKIRRGQMLLHQNQESNQVEMERSGWVRELPFYIKLEDFRIEYYKTGAIRDFISDVQVIKNGNVIAEKSIEVNHPLHFSGYHFYQSSYDALAHSYAIFTIVSDSGLNLVYAGYLMLGIGVFWHFWIKHIFTKRNGN